MLCHIMLCHISCMPTVICWNIVSYGMSCHIISHVFAYGMIPYCLTYTMYWHISCHISWSCHVICHSICHALCHVIFYVICDVMSYVLSHMHIMTYVMHVISYYMSCHTKNKAFIIIIIIPCHVQKCIVMSTRHVHGYSGLWYGHTTGLTRTDFVSLT